MPKVPFQLETCKVDRSDGLHGHEDRGPLRVCPEGDAGEHFFEGRHSNGSRGALVVFIDGRQGFFEEKQARDGVFLLGCCGLVTTFEGHSMLGPLPHGRRYERVREARRCLRTRGIEIDSIGIV